MKAITCLDTRADAIRSGHPWIFPRYQTWGQRTDIVIHTSARTRRGGNHDKRYGSDVGRTGLLHGIARLEHILRVDAVRRSDSQIEWSSDGIDWTVSDRALTACETSDDDWLWLFGPTRLFTEPIPWPGKNTLVWDAPCDDLCPTCGYPVVIPPGDEFGDPHAWEHLHLGSFDGIEQARTVL